MFLSHIMVSLSMLPRFSRLRRRIDADRDILVLRLSPCVPLRFPRDASLHSSSRVRPSNARARHQEETQHLPVQTFYRRKNSGKVRSSTSLHSNSAYKRGGGCRFDGQKLSALNDFLLNSTSNEVPHILTRDLTNRSTDPPAATRICCGCKSPLSSCASLPMTKSMSRFSLFAALVTLLVFLGETVRQAVLTCSFASPITDSEEEPNLSSQSSSDRASRS